MTEKKSREDLVALLDAYADQSLDEVDRREVHQALLDDEDLREEYEEIKLTLELFREIPSPSSPQDMVQRVRAKLAEDAQQEKLANGRPLDDVTNQKPQLSLEVLQESFAKDVTSNMEKDGTVTSLWPRRFMEVGLALCASAALVVGIVFAGGTSTDIVSEGGFHAAGVGQEQVATSVIEVVGLKKETVHTLANAHALLVIDGSDSKVVLEGRGIDALAFCQQGRSKVALSGKWRGLNPKATGKVRLVLNLSQ
ncbi:MAG: hypothetical protein GY822_13610 [Deltaproteobacteria bacterium]|nr:hypothetical protein [Deltaproteobacteria bacterium]